MAKNTLKCAVVASLVLFAPILRAGFQHGSAEHQQTNPSGVQQANGVQHEVLVSVNGRPLQSALLANATSAVDLASKRAVLAEAIDEELLFRLAYEAAWHEGQILPANLSAVDRQKLVVSYVQKRHAQVQPISELKARQHYEKNPLLFAERKNYKLSAAFIEKGDALDSVAPEQWLRIRDWDTFSGLVKRHKLSVKYQSFNLPSEALPAQHLGSIRSAGLGGMRVLVQDRYWVIVSVDEVSPAPLTWTEAKHAILDQLMRDKHLESTAELLSSLRSSASIRCAAGLPCEDLPPSRWAMRLAAPQLGPFFKAVRTLGQVSKQKADGRLGGPGPWERMRLATLSGEQRDAAFRLFGQEAPWQIHKNLLASGGSEYQMQLPPINYQRELGFGGLLKSSTAKFTASFDRSGKKGTTQASMSYLRGYDDLIGSYLIDDIKQFATQKEGIGGVWFGRTEIGAKKIEFQTEKGVIGIAEPKFRFDLVENGRFADLAVGVSIKSVSVAGEVIGPMSMSWSLNNLHAAATAELLQGVERVDSQATKDEQDAQIKTLMSRVGPEILTNDTSVNLNELAVTFRGATAKLSGQLKWQDQADVKLMTPDTWMRNFQGRFRLVVPIALAKSVISSVIKFQSRNEAVTPEQISQAEQNAWNELVLRLNQKNLVRWVKGTMQTDFDVSKGKLLINGVDFQTLTQQ